MFNNRMLAVAAVLVMAVPALGAATPIVVPPVPEQLVEGHTVFTVIEIVRATTTTEVRFAAAVAVLVREVEKINVAQRFPGVLWFNDQYLVNPTSSREDAADFRYPCGGAVMAVNAGDPDPRILLARLDTPVGSIHVGDANHTYEQEEYWNKPDTSAGDFTGYYGQDSGGPGDDATDYALLGMKPDGTVYSDVNSFEYIESYLITDPNDHAWQIDKYLADSTRIGGGTATNPDYFFVWVVNILGSPVFTTDEVDGDNETNIDTGVNALGVNCLPYLDILPEEVQAATCDTSIPKPQGPATPGNTATGPVAPLFNHNVDGGAADSENEANVPQNFGTGQPFVDDPCMGYMEPSSNGYCYGGQLAQDDNGDTVVDKADCEFARAAGESSAKPLRYYNAVLYFRFEDLTIAGAPRDHAPGSTDTNGCAEEVYWWGSTQSPGQGSQDPAAGPLSGQQYSCPADDDNAEGNSHPFHPTAPAHEDVQPCPPEFGGPNPTNHGGSSGLPAPYPTDEDGYYTPGTPCDYLHGTRNIDIYFSGGGRPLPPVVPNYWLIDMEGSSAPFNGFDGSPTGH